MTVRVCRWVVLTGLVGVALSAGSFRSLTEAGAQSLAPLSYTAEQAAQGATAYAQNCASCHGEYLDDGEFGPTLKGSDFRARWSSKSTESLFSTISERMPPAQPGRLGDVVHAQILAYLLQQNSVPAGPNALSDDPAVLKSVEPPNWAASPGGGLSAGVSLPPAPRQSNPLETMRPVTEAMLRTVGDGEWLTWRRSNEALAFSPLKQINRRNVTTLRVAWTWSLPNGPNESVPLVHDGVLFVHSFGDKVQALNAATGDLLWQYSRRLPKGVSPGPKRSLAIFEELLYVSTSDAHIVALNTKTGTVAWDQAVADRRAGFTLTSGPLVAAGRVMIGTTGRSDGGNFIVGLDARTGKETWKFHVIARPGGPGGNSWNGLPLEKRHGGSLWIPGTYDPVSNLAFFAPGNTYDTLPLRDLKEGEEGTTNDGLYLDSTLALNPETGALQWYYQHQANGQWDLDWAFERQIVQLPVNGRKQSVVVTGGKQAIFDALDTMTGRYLWSMDLGLQNIVTSIDPNTGRKTVDPALIPGRAGAIMVCPHVSGGRMWMPTSYSPDEKTLYVPLTEACMDMIPVGAGERGRITTGFRWTLRPRPDSDGKYGRLQAVNLETRKPAWTFRQRAPFTTGTLITSGGLVFAGSLDRTFSAHDSATGDRLWSTRLNDVPNSSPISFTAMGKQYVAIVVGGGAYNTISYLPLVPEIRNPPEPGAALWVFEVPVNGSREKP